MRTRHLASLSLALTLGAATIAAAQSTATPAQTEVAPPNSAAATNSRSTHRHWRHHSRLFRGVYLTTDERAKLSTIREQYHAQLQPLVQQFRTARHAIRAAAARTDTAAVAAARATMRDVRAKFTSVRTQWMTDARGVLTPEQQTQFDRNAARLQRHQRKS
jgi:Spy/CpxP family protein refolding chaperone